MPAPNVLREKQKKQIKPLIEALNKAFEGQTRISIADQSGLTNYQVGRILGDYLPAPTYLDITKLILASGMTPDEAAEVIGLFDGKAANDQRPKPEQSAYERRILHLLRTSNLTNTQRSMLTQVIEATVRGLEGHALLDSIGEAEGEGPTDDEEESHSVASPRR